MSNESIDKDYFLIVNHILNNEEFKKIDGIEHHGISRFDHSFKISYFSYKICKLLHLDYECAARAGLLHDFFLSDENRTFKDKFLSTFTHPKKAVENSIKNFNISEKEENIIRAHMFPFYTALPKYAESWIIILVDKIIVTY